MKKSISITLIIAVICCTFLSLSVGAASENYSVVDIEFLNNGDYIETVISDIDEQVVPSVGRTSKSITKTKTRYYKNSEGTVLWSVSITGTFTYNGTTSTCTSCSHKTTSPASAWSIKSSSHSKSGNTATARATATYKTATTSKDYPMSVSIKCSASGTIS